MVRLSDFIFPTLNPPYIIETPVEAEIAKLRIPGKLGNVQQHMGTDNMRFDVRGGMYSISTDTDKRFTDMMSLMDLFYTKTPYTFTHNADHPCGTNGDNWSEYTSTTAMDVDWTVDGPTRAVESTNVKVGSKSIKLTNVGTGNRRMTLDNYTDLKLDRPQFSSLCFWLRAGDIGADDDITVKIYTTTLSHYYERLIDVSAEFSAVDTWKEIILPVGTGASTRSVVSTDGWHVGAGTPDWNNIDGITLEWAANADDGNGWYIDGFCLTHAVLFSGAPTFTYPTGGPNQINYRLSLEQYIQ